MAALLGTIGAMEAASVRVTWNANTEPDMASYRVYAESEKATNVVSVQHPIAIATLTNLTAGVTWSIYATALNTNGMESERSTVLTWTAEVIPATPPPTPPPAMPEIVGWSGSRMLGDTWVVMLRWSPVTNVSNYHYRFTHERGSQQSMTTGFMVTAIVGSLPLQAEVWATNISGASAVASVKFVRPGKPQNVKSEVIRPMAPGGP